ncbi:MAG: glycosyltransferase [Alphaproteobacteria bacterium]
MLRIEAHVTVVIPCYNAERWVGRAIRSALDQEGVAVEVIVVDDGSTDASLDVIRSFGDRIRFETGPNCGACAARNRGLEMATAPYVMFLDADDYLEGAFLRAGVARLHETGADLGFGPMAVEHNGHRRYRTPPMVDTPSLMVEALVWRGGLVLPCATLWRRAFVQDIGAWREGLRRYQDFELVFRAIAAHPPFTFWSDGVGVYFQHEGPRISRLYDPAALSEVFDVIRLTKVYWRTAGVSAQAADFYARQLAYSLYRQAARTENRQGYELAFSEWRRLGGRWHGGSFTHFASATLLGLWTKEKLALAIRRLPARLFARRRA